MHGTFAPGGHDFVWKGPAIGLLDLDAFFASVEQLDHPEWRGKPLIVGGSPERRGVVTTASYEARPFGVHSAMPSAQAVRLCPQAIWTQGRFDRYREVSDQVMALLRDETPLVEQVSIDEAFFDVTPGRFNREDPVAICDRVRARVRSLGVTCSVGLGVNKTVAKIASDQDKPDGLTVVPPGTEGAFLEDLPVGAMSGVGPATERHLHELGVRTLGQLARQDPEAMRHVFGVTGPRLVERAAGRERSSVSPDPDPVKSVSNERTFSQDLTREEDLRAAVLSVAAKVGARLRRKGLEGRLVTVRLKYDVTHTKSAQAPLPQATDDEHVFGPVAWRLAQGLWQPGLGIRLVGVGLSRFGEEDGGAVQLELFSESPSPEAESVRPRHGRDLSTATDSIRERFGDGALVFGRDLRLKDRETDTTPMNKDRF